MEEIDTIIIETLKNLHCDIEDDIKSLKQFDADMVAAAVSSCLQAISPDTTFSKKLPPSMSLKLKIASSLAEQVKDVGFRGDIGYQTILYCNEPELRRVLMFLIERLPRDVHKATTLEETGYVPRVVKQIEKNVRLSLDQLWLPSNILNNGTRSVDGQMIVNSLGNSCPVSTQKLKCPHMYKSTAIDEEVLKNYWIHVVPEVTKQCSSQLLTPSLLFGNMQFKSEYFRDILSNKTRKNVERSVAKEQSTPIVTEDVESQISSVELNTKESPTKIKMQDLVTEIEEEKKKYEDLKDVVQKYELQLSQLRAAKEKEDEILKAEVSKVKVKTKALLVASKEENKVKLKALVENGNDRLVELANQWNEVQTPLLEEYKTLKNSLSSEQLRHQQDQVKLESLKQLYSDLVTDLKEKEVLEETLIKKCQQISKTNSRSAYTRRIMEIIGNIKKQDLEIQKVLKETKEVQKEINNLTGQVDRSFTLCDELIFRDAKYDDTARKAYKMLVSLRDDCSETIQDVREIGVVEREVRNLQDQIELESAKEISQKLERVLIDLEEVKKETANLVSRRKK